MAKSRPPFAPFPHTSFAGRALVSMVGMAAMSIAACTPDRLAPPRCGDGNIDFGEVCDDENVMIGDGCNTSCQLEPNSICEGEPSDCRALRCGDGIQDSGEACDDGAESAACNADCTLARCGDGIENAARGEQCDDENVMSGDGCSPTCLTEPSTCGDDTCDLDGAETCENCLADCMALPACNDCPDNDDDGYFAMNCGGNDCDDNNNMVHPDADEILCNRINEDCDGTTSDTEDADMDGFNCLLDCDDTSALASPANRNEVCGDGVDNDCDPETTEDGDVDGDTFNCTVDCNDNNAMVYPGRTEICNNGVNDDCDRDAMGVLLATATRDVFDGDGDGAFCNVDCNDMNMSIRPGVTDIMCSGVDEDCNPTTTDGPDVDRDGASCALDCDDNDARRSTLLTEICGDLIDNDCNVATPDSGDADGDTFDCSVDCDDTDPLVFPDAVGRCGERFVITEDFETCPVGWTTNATAGTSSWACGTPAATFITAAAGGTRAWVTNLTGTYTDNQTSFLTSPVMDFTATSSDPVLSFDHIFETENCCDEGWVEVSTDGGTTWRKVGAAGQGANWYNNATAQQWNGTSGAVGVWRRASNVLTGTAGRASVRIRFAFSSDTSSVEDGFGVDNLRIDNGAIDLNLTSVTAALSQCSSGTSVAVTAIVSNSGSVTIPTFDISYSVDGGTPVVSTQTRVLRGGDSRTISLSVDVGTAGSHMIAVTATAVGDDIATNNSRTATIVATAAPAPTVIPVTASGYLEGFETDAGGWSSASASGPNSWARGIPTGSFISSAGTGSYAWVTNPAGEYVNNENSFLTSPCLDLSALTADPILTFQHIFETEGCCDEGWIDVWTASTGWVRLGTSGPGMNWYNDASNRWWDGTSGAAGAWRTASFSLAGTAGQVIRVRHGFSTDTSSVEDGFGIDTVEIRP